MAMLPASLWWPLFLYLMYLPIGPWMLACVSARDVPSHKCSNLHSSTRQRQLLGKEWETCEAGCNWGLITASGIYMSSEEGWWRRVSTEDMLLVTNVHMVRHSSDLHGLSRCGLLIIQYFGYQMYLTKPYHLFLPNRSHALFQASSG
jgi:hypothetical protein